MIQHIESARSQKQFKANHCKLLDSRPSQAKDTGWVGGYIVKIYRGYYYSLPLS